jgi:hypothetical protein
MRLWRPRRKGGSTVARTEMQSREGPRLISATIGMRNANNGCIWGRGLSHEAIVAVMRVITSPTSQGPLGVRGHDMHGVPGLLPERATRPLEKPSHACMAKPMANLSSRQGRPRVMEAHGAWNRTEEISPSGILEGLGETRQLLSWERQFLLLKRQGAPSLLDNHF